MKTTPESRLNGTIHDISYSATLEFFEGRGRVAQPDAPLMATMYQNSSLASKRDAWEKETVLRLLALRGNESVLDIGCGCGRWAEALAGRIGSYLGVDFSRELLKLAEKHGCPSVRFQCLSVQDFSPAALIVPPPFDLFICAGILIYLNDRDVLRLGHSIAEVASRRAHVYVREPMATEERLTLDRFHSAELEAEYSAIYRTLAQCNELFGEPLHQAGFRCTLEQALYPPELCNRKETEQYIQLWTRL